ncbi:MAG: putative lipid II flippase FtsW [Pseudomonadota bacterium]
MTTPPRLRKLRHIDPVLFLSALALLGLGTVMVYSSSSLVAADRFGDNLYYLKHHLAYAALGFAAMGTLFFVNIRGLRRLALPALGLAALALAVTALTSAGVSAKSATRWLSIGGITVQPAEFAKPLIVLYIASYLSRRGEGIRDFRRGLLPLLVTLGILFLLILRQPDFGTCVVIAATAFLMLFVGRARLWHMAALGLSSMGAGLVLIQGAAYRRRRLLAFLDPWKDPAGSGFQIIQSFVAFNRGGMVGAGLGDGAQKLLYLPEAHTDFIFSVIAEELGIWGSIGVIILFLFLVVRGLQLALRIREPFASELAYGLTVMIGIQALMNMAVVMGLTPTKGLTLPLVSYGGSSLVATMASVGILLSLASTVSLSKKMARKVEA